MKTTIRILTGLLVLLGCLIPQLGYSEIRLVAGHSPEDAMKLGETMYRTGLLPSGEPMQAFVQGDIPVDGIMFSCESCHLRSGLGTAEGTIITLPTNGGKLFKPLHRGAEIDVTPAREQLSKPFQSQDIRPAYRTLDEIKDALWKGVDPGGRVLNETMPRYLLAPADMNILVYYLSNLSTGFSPGVDDTTLSFATIVTDDVSAADRVAFLDTLQVIIRDHNSQSRHEIRRTKQGPFYRQDRYTAYRLFELHVWELKGPRESWTRQLEAYYRQTPVFAVLSGISNQDWTPVHDFCETMELPNIFPLTRRPVIDETSWYTLYFSKGSYQEGEAAARYLRPARGEDPPRLVQIVRETPESLAASRGFAETWRQMNLPTPPTEAIRSERPLDPQQWRSLAERHPGALLLAWLPATDLAGAGDLFPPEEKSLKMIFSGTLLNGDHQSIPENIRPRSLMTWPYRLPEDIERREQLVQNWLKVRKISTDRLEIQSQLYFLSWLMTGVTRMMGDDFYRDYFFDVIDMMNDETYAITRYPRLSFGPGQRFASKGCYLVEIETEPEFRLIPKTDWVIH